MLPFWMLIAIWVVWVLMSITAVDIMRVLWILRDDPFAQLTNSAYVFLYAWFSLTPFWICWNIWG